MEEGVTATREGMQCDTSLSDVGACIGSHAERSFTTAAFGYGGRDLIQGFLGLRGEPKKLAHQCSSLYILSICNCIFSGAKRYRKTKTHAVHP